MLTSSDKAVSSQLPTLTPGPYMALLQLKRWIIGMAYFHIYMWQYVRW